MDRKQIDELMEAYAFGILDEEERQAVERYLDTGDEACLRRVREAAEVSARLAEGVRQRQPGSELKAELFRRIRSEDAAVAPAPAPRAEVTVSRLSSWLRLAWVTAAVATAAAAFFMWRTADLQNELSQANSQLKVSAVRAAALEAEVNDYRRRMLMGDPGVQFVTMEGIDPNPQAVGWVVLRPKGDSGIVYLYDFPVQPAGKQYQLWSYRGKDRIASAGVFTVDDTGAAILEMKKIEDAECITEFAVTIEPRGGMQRPTGMMYVRGDNLFHDSHH